MKRAWLNSLLLVSFFYIPLFLFDIGLQIYTLSLRKDNSDPRTRFEVVTELRKRSPNVYPAFAPINLLKQPDMAKQSPLTPLSGVSNSTIVFSKEGGEWLIYKSDQFGFNNHGITWDDYIQKGCDIVFIGDSFTQGATAPSGRIFADLVRKKYPRTINLGTASTGPIVQTGIFREYATLIRPKHVLWCYYEGNDLGNMERERSWDPMNKYLIHAYKQGLADKQEEIDSFLIAFIEESIKKLKAKKSKGPKYGPYYLSVRSFNPLHALGLRNARSFINARLRTDMLFLSSIRGEEEKTDHSENIEIFKKILNEVKETSASWGGQLTFVYMPAIDSIYGRCEENREKILEMVRALELPIIDFYVSFQKYPDPKSLFNIPWGKHYSPEGHRLMADVFLRYFRSKPERMEKADHSQVTER